MAHVRDLRKAKAVLLLSGGIDSPVAGALMQKQGMEVHALHCSTALLTDPEAERKSLALATMLGFSSFHVADANALFAALATQCAHRLYFVLSKRMMLRLAERLAHTLGAEAIITGENLAQVSSQTLTNLGVIQDAASLPVLRPLLAYDKLEIIRLAEEMGTYETSKGPEHCDALGPSSPATNSTVDIIQREESKIDVEAFVKNAMVEKRA